MELYILSAIGLLIGIGGIIYGAGAKLATKKELRELEERIDKQIVEHERQNREDMRSINEALQRIESKIDTKINRTYRRES